jgi:hypothetical protein
MLNASAVISLQERSVNDGQENLLSVAVHMNVFLPTHHQQLCILRLLYDSETCVSFPIAMFTLSRSRRQHQPDRISKMAMLLWSYTAYLVQIRGNI